MNRLLAGIAMTVTMSISSFAASDAFDQHQTGAMPPDWTAGVTGRGDARWSVEADSSAPSKPNVLKQSGVGDFPWAVKSNAKIANGHVEVKFKPLSGKHDQAGGVVWRWKDGNNYYVARANALENNVSLYYTEKGRRNTLKYVEAPVPLGAWHVLRVEFRDKRIRVLLNGKQYIDLEDAHIAGEGAVGVWTKADSVTLFDDFEYGDVR
jgi:hypothetical protein